MAEGIELGVANLNLGSKYFCHHCSREVTPPSFSSELLCPVCYSSFVEEVTDTEGSFPIVADYDSDFGEEDLSLLQETNFDHRRFISRMFDYLHHSPEPEPILDEPEVNEEVGEDSERLEFLNLFRENESFHIPNDVEDVYRVRFFDGDYTTEDDVDAIASQLLDEVEISGPPPLAKEQIKSLPMFTFDTEEEVNDRQCTICMNDFKVGEKAKKLTCNHLFHEKCISPWLAKQASCPNCRSVIRVESKDKHCPNCPRFSQTGSHSRSRSATGMEYFSTSLNPFRLI